MPAIDSLGTEYLTLALEIERLFPGFVDAYHGPDSLQVRANSGDQPDPKALRDRAQRLLTDILISDYGDNRKEYLRGQVTGMVTTCRKLAGETLGFLEEVRDCYDIAVDLIPDAEFDRALSELDAVLPGAGSLRERYAAYRQQYVVDQATAARLIDLILTETREWTRSHVELPENDSVEIRFVSDQPWSGYNWYLGNGHSRVEINTDLPIHATRLPHLVAHEAYPGHHTEHSLKEIRLYHGKGYAEHAIQLINTPQCVISEGIAVLAQDFAFDGDLEGWMARDLMPAVGLPFDPDLFRQIQRASRMFRAVSANAAILFHRDGLPDRDVIQYFEQYALMTHPEAEKRFSFISDPLWRPYTFTYNVGRDLLAAWLDQADAHERLQRFRSLLTQQFTPSQITRAIAAA